MEFGAFFKVDDFIPQNRSQFVSLSGENSSIKHMQYNVPQGSILGP